MAHWSPDRIRPQVAAAIVSCGGAQPGQMGDGNTVGDFYPGAADLPSSVKACITIGIKQRCELTKFWWPGALNTTIGHLIRLVQMYQDLESAGPAGGAEGGTGNA